MVIYLDFDGTVVEHRYPGLGRCNFGCMEIILKLQEAGHTIILNTYRADLDKEAFREAQNYLNKKSWMLFKDRTKELELKPITLFMPLKLTPSRWDWNWIRDYKIMFIDDIASGIPLKKAVVENNMMVDWDELDKQFIEHHIYDKID